MWFLIQEFCLCGIWIALLHLLLPSPSPTEWHSKSTGTKMLQESPDLFSSLPPPPPPEKRSGPQTILTHLWYFYSLHQVLLHDCGLNKPYNNVVYSAYVLGVSLALAPFQRWVQSSYSVLGSTHTRQCRSGWWSKPHQYSDGPFVSMTKKLSITVCICTCTVCHRQQLKHRWRRVLTIV